MGFGRFLSAIRFILRKGFFVVKRDGFKMGLKRGFVVLKEIKHNRKFISSNTTLFDIRGMQYQKKGGGIYLKLLPEPLVSIVIPVLNGVDYVKDCIESLYASQVRFTYEVIVVDQHSTDGILNILRNYSKKHDNFLLIENKKNLGFAEGLNRGVSRAKGKFVVLANSDLVFTPGWLDPLVDLAMSDAQVAVISPMTNYVGEGPQVDCEAINLMPKEAAKYAQKISNRKGEIQVVDRLVFFCVLIKKNIYDLLGGLSGIYSIGNYEDDDFCLRARLIGFTLKIVKSSFVFHLGSKTFKRQKIDYVNIMTRNEKIFFQRTVDFSLSSRLLPVFRGSTKDVTVILRTKNRPYFLSQSLNSLAVQTFKNFDVVIIDQGDVDIRPIIGERMKDLQINYINDYPGNGRGAALNLGLNQTTSQWVTYLDDDDLIYPTHLENLVTTISAQMNASLVYTDVNKSLCWADEKNQNVVTLARERFIQKDFQYEELLFDNFIPILSFMHYRDEAILVGGYDESLDIFEDWDFLLRLTKDRKVVRIPRITCEYRIRFADRPNDTTLFDREKAWKFRKIIYQRYPATNDRVHNLREVTEDIVKLQIEEVKNITKMNVSDLEKSFRIAAKLGAFRSIGETIYLSTQG